MTLRGAAAGVLAAAVAVGTSEVAAALVRPRSAPIVAVGDRIVELSPHELTGWAITTFGAHDKAVLIGGVLLLLAVLAALSGVVSSRRVEFGLAGIAVGTAWAAYCSVSTSGSRASDVIPALVGGAAAAITLLWLTGERSEPAESATAGAGPETASGAPVQPLSRRSFIMLSGAVAGFATLTGFGGRWWQQRRFDVTASRQRVRLPTATEPAPDPTPSELGLTARPWVTSNGDFYRVDTALNIPQVPSETWQLRIHGMVDREITLTFEQLLSRPFIERWITLNCVSAEVGDPYTGNARWLGTQLTDLLLEAGIHQDADQLVMTDVNGMTIGAPAKVVMDGRDALLAVGMNGEPLPQSHGYPVRVVVAGLYGYVSACKWIVDLEATTYAKKAYWAEEGWAEFAELELMSRIDTPKQHKRLDAGVRIPVAGVAWDQHIGISAVEIQVDEGAWHQANLAPVPSTDTWRQWVWYWTPTPGDHTLRVRATDAQGRTQTAKARRPYPYGATGHHEVTVHVV